MQKSCKQCGLSFEITPDDLAFYEQISPVFGGKKYLIPPPTLCPDCRQQRRLAQCNEFFLSPGECGLCHKRTLTEYASDDPRPIYCRDCWHSDKWDATSYGKSFDLSRPFFEQFSELKKNVPAPALNVQGTVINSDYIHYAGSCKNCYLIMHADFCEDCYYGYGFKKNRSCVDGFYNLHSELLYDCIDCHKCYGLKSCQDCINCSSSAFLRDCIGCKNCFLCVGLREKEYCFENQQLTKEQYVAKLQAIDTGSHEQYTGLRKRLKELELKHAFKEFQGHNTENCLGNHLVNCKNAQSCFDCEDVEDAKFCTQIVLGGKNIYDVYQYGSNLRESYECTISGENTYHVLFSDNCHISSADLLYCSYMEGSKNCFGCANMQRAKYCILNKQYTKEEYEEVVPKIIEHMKSTGEWGEFFPMPIASFGYNRTTAALWFPLKKEEALALGANWDNTEPPPPTATKIIPAAKLPDSIEDIPDDIVNWAIVCEVTGKPFKIIAPELKFYREQHLPIPRRAWFQRHLDRFHQRNPRKLWQRTCDKCSAEIRTTYSPERPEKIYCEKCYLETVY